MIKAINNKAIGFYATLMTGLLVGSGDASAGGQDFGDIARNISQSIEELPGLLSGVAYLIGLILAVLGILKVKDHVENPTQTPLKDGAIRIVTGGALFALPIVLEAMENTIGFSTAGVSPALLNKVEFNVQ